uniref:DNA-directed RNA polymerase n=1 Tax=Pithovirus LCPAC304 TaxID=2506594 RepID=A0A481Z8K0_9VIRU|nr:MAG: DNA-directed RNA polymerase subunit beta [Pithovirus LCPAC304]
MWSKTFLEADEWKKVRDSLPKLIYDSWDSLSERLKRSSVTRCAQQLMESESTTEKAVDPFLRQIKTGEAFKPIKTIDDISTDLPMPNPLSAHLIPVEKADPGIPGEIVIDENGKLLKRYLRYTNFTKFLKDSYDEWLLNGLIPLIENQVIDVRGGRIRFAHVSLTPPRDGGQKLFPRMAREKGLTYGLDIHARVILEKDLGDGRVEEVTLGDNVSKTKKTLGRIPLMLGSKKCYLYGFSPSQLRAVQEDPSDPLGYFVVSGTEKVVLMHEKLRLNRIFVTSKKRGKDKEPEASITIETPRGTVRVNLVLGKSKRINFATRFKVEIKPSSEKGKERTEEEEQHDRRRAIRAAATAKKDGNYRYIGVEKLFYILRLLENPGISDEGDGADFERWPEFMTEKIVQFTKAEWRNKVEAEIGILRFKYPNEKPAFVKQEIARIKGGVNIHDAKDVDEVVRNLVMHEIFPQLNDLGDIENIFTLKSNMLALMVARLIEVNLGLEDYDDRDSWSNKRLESASRAMDQLMRAIWRRMVTNMKKELTNKNSIDSTAAIERQLSKIGITNIFNASFVGTNWGVQGSMKTNMTQIPNRESVVSLFSHMHRVEVATNRNDKQPSIRMIHGTQWGYICVTGDTQVSIDQNHTRPIRELEDGDKVVTVSKKDLSETPSRIQNYFETKPTKLLKITTMSGRTIKCTPDHPFLVQRSLKDAHQWVKAGDLKISDCVVVKHTLDVIQEEKDTKLVIDSALIPVQYRVELSKLGLLDCNLTQRHSEVLARLIGASITDGTIGKREKGYYNASFYLGEEADVMEISDDITFLGFACPSIRRKITHFGDKCVHKTWEVSKNGAFACLLVSLGAFVGKKTNQCRKIPEWIMNANLNTVRAFLSGFQGGDGGRVTAYHNVRKWKLSITPTHQFSTEKYYRETIRYLEQIQSLFSRFMINTTIEHKISSSNPVMYAVKLSFVGDLENISIYSNNITYSYCYEKRRKSSSAIEYAKYRAFSLKKRKESYDQAYSMFGTLSAKEISENTGIPTKQLYRLKSSAKKGKRIQARCSSDLLDYDIFVSKYKDLEDKLAIPIQTIQEIPVETVYDFETFHSNHSFIANGFVTHNCPAESPEGANCMGINTLVETPSGPIKIIELKNGDDVICVNPITHEKEVTQIYRHFTKPAEIFQLKVVGGWSAKATSDHPFLAKGNVWIELKDLDVGDCVYHDGEGCFLPITSITPIGEDSVCDFTTISDHHSFIGNGFVTHNCGIVKNLTVTAQVTYGKTDGNVLYEIIHARLEEDGDTMLFSKIPSSRHTSPVLVNGKFLGWCMGVELRRYMIQARRSQRIPIDAGITVDVRNALLIHTDTSRLVRPLLVVEPVTKDDGKVVLEPLIVTKGLMGAPIKTLFEEKVIEYVDSFEVESSGMVVATTFDSIKDPRRTEKMLVTSLSDFKKNKKNVQRRLKRKPKHEKLLKELAKWKVNIDSTESVLNKIRNTTPFSHVEMDPQSILGISASIIPYPNHNQGPRNTYQCLWEEEPVLMSNGTSKKIKDIKVGDNVLTFDPETMETFSTYVVDSYTRETDKKIVQVSTISGRHITVTSDHKMMTHRGWVEAGKLQLDDTLAISLEQNPMSNACKEWTILSIYDFEQKLKEHNVKDTLVRTHSSRLQKEGLLPLTSTHPKLYILARMFGFILTDGSLGVYRNRPTVQGDFGCVESAEEFENDVVTIGFNKVKIRDKISEFRGSIFHTKAVSHEGAFCSLILALGYRPGKMTTQSYLRAPRWITNTSVLVKREFLAGVQGGDGCKIRWNKMEKRGYNFVCGDTLMTVRNEYVQSLRHFMGDVAEAFKSFGIECKVVEYPAKYEGSTQCGVRIRCTSNNLQKYFSIVGYRYCLEKTVRSGKVVEYLRYKNQLVSSYRKEIKEIRRSLKEGKRIPIVAREHNVSYSRVSGISRALGNGREPTMRNLRVSEKPDKWTIHSLARTIFVPIISVDEKDRVKISDITTESATHSFIGGDGFCVHNSSMGKQALGINRAHTMACFSGKHKVLAYPNRPLFEPQLNQLLNLNAYPQGEMVWMMFGTFTGNTQEDAIVFNQASIDMGKFRLFKYNNIRVVFKSESNKVEELRRPSDLSEEELKNAYKHMNVNGLPTIGAHIEERQAVVGKVVMEGKEEIANDSLRLGYGEEGIVNQVIVTDNGAETIVKVQLRMLRIPIAGDKYSPRNAQKGTIGKIVPSWEMPYTEDGIIPDIIVNPHAMPSRMTMSFPMEIIASKAGAIKGERINATAFREFEAERFKSILRDYGYADDGKHVMYNGITGRALTARMYSGPVYYQALRHHVLDKIQVRRTGPYSATSRQPVKGRAKKGGLRFGEMERDAAIAHGASFFLQERLCGVSDRCIDIYCIKCGQIATALDQGYSCNLCEDEAVFAKAETTAALRLLNMLAGGFGIKQVPKF